VPPSELARLRLERAKQACSPPPFDLGFDSPEETDKQALNSETNPATVGVMAGVDIVTERLYDEDDWDDDTWKEAIDAVDRVEAERGYINTATLVGSEAEQVVSVFKTPARVGNSTAANGEMSGSTTVALCPQVQERRIIRLPHCLKSPYLTYDNKSLFTCSSDVKDLYDAVTSHGRRTSRRQGEDKTPIIVSYNKFFVSLRELANSMMPCWWLHNTVMELGIESIMLRKDKKLKKIVLPLRVSVSFLHRRNFLTFLKLILNSVFVPYFLKFVLVALYRLFSKTWSTTKMSCKSILARLLPISTGKIV
jgi:hypothetical protein